MILGMIPDCDVSKVVAVGNAAGDGARIALLNLDTRAEAGRIAESVRHVQIAVSPEFQNEFVGAMAIPHASDRFPHLTGILPAASPTIAMRPSQRRRAKQTEEQTAR
jgi:uncharacterized 2Fe-2S/4Fe-4S cluster protein (DUF4445 family)